MITLSGLPVLRWLMCETVGLCMNERMFLDFEYSDSRLLEASAEGQPSPPTKKKNKNKTEITVCQNEAISVVCGRVKPVQ